MNLIRQTYVGANERNVLTTKVVSIDKYVERQNTYNYEKWLQLIINLIGVGFFRTQNAQNSKFKTHRSPRTNDQQARSNGCPQETRNS